MIVTLLALNLFVFLTMRKMDLQSKIYYTLLLIVSAFLLFSLISLYKLYRKKKSVTESVKKLG